MIRARVARQGDCDAAQYEKGVALFELCRFAEARRAFEKVATTSSDRAHALPTTVTKHKTTP